jgi:sphinganine-1-phosphate aldolase
VSGSASNASNKVSSGIDEGQRGEIIARSVWLNGAIFQAHVAATELQTKRNRGTNVLAALLGQRAMSFRGPGPTACSLSVIAGRRKCLASSSRLTERPVLASFSPVETSMAKERLARASMQDHGWRSPDPTRREAATNRHVFPSAGESWPALQAKMHSMRRDDVDWRRGKAPLHIYHPGDDAAAVVREAYCMFMSENALSAAAFPSLERMEQDVVGAAIGLLHGPASAAGSITSGGTESIILAVKAARRRAADRLGDGRRGEILLARTAHPAFDKAADLMGLDVVRVPTGADRRAEPRVFGDAVTDRTVLMAASAPSLPFGLIDPVEELSEVAMRHDVWLHVDACIGGFIAPFARRLGYSIPRFDFSLPGVRSISADLHKFGYAAKGASTILYRRRSDHGLQSFRFYDWPKGRYDTATLLGTRSGGAIAAAWAIIHYLGETGYLELTDRVMKLRDRFVAGILAIDGLSLVARPHLSVLAYTSPSYDIAAVGDQLQLRGWYVSRTADPPGIHQTINPVHEGAIDDYVADLAAAAREVKQHALVGRDAEVLTY